MSPWFEGFALRYLRGKVPPRRETSRYFILLANGKHVFIIWQSVRVLGDFSPPWEIGEYWDRMNALGGPYQVCQYGCGNLFHLSFLETECFLDSVADQ